MQPILVNNFVEMWPLEIRTIKQKDESVLIALTQWSGAMNFQHAMTVEQAIDMAKKILEVAYELQEVAA